MVEQFSHENRTWFDSRMLKRIREFGFVLTSCNRKEHVMTLYEANCENVREILSAQKTMKKMFNQALRNNSFDQISCLTKTYVNLYSAFAEASFLKLVYTPYVFNDSERRQIVILDSLEKRWMKFFELTYKKLSKKNSGEKANKIKKLNSIYKEYIFEPSKIRNKIAHGQWKIALNKTNTAINNDTTSKIEKLDFVVIDYYFEIYKQFQQCMEDILESPKAHYRDYYPLIIKLDEFIKERRNWTIETKRAKLNSSSKMIGYKQHHSKKP